MKFTTRATLRGESFSAGAGGQKPTGVRLTDGDFQGDAGALGFDVLDSKVSATALGNSVTDAQAQSGALSIGLGCVKGIEGTVQIGKAGAAIFHLNDSARVGAVRPNFDLPGPGRVVQGIAGIVEEIEQNLLDFIFVDGERWQIRGNFSFNRQMRCARPVLAEGQNFVHDRSELG